MGDGLGATIMWRVEPVVHAGCQPQRHIAAVAERCRVRAIHEQIGERVRVSLDLEDLTVRYQPCCADYGVTGAGQSPGIHIDRPGTVL